MPSREETGTSVCSGRHCQRRSSRDRMLRGAPEAGSTSRTRRTRSILWAGFQKTGRGPNGGCASADSVGSAGSRWLRVILQGARPFGGKTSSTRTPAACRPPRNAGSERMAARTISSTPGVPLRALPSSPVTIAHLSWADCRSGAGDREAYPLRLSAKRRPPACGGAPG